MKDSRINYVTVGGFTLAMLIAFLVVISLLTGRTGSTATYFTRLNNVTGIKYGTKVTYEGFAIGQVESIVPVRDGGLTSFKVNLAVTDKWLIPTDSVARVAASGILAAAVIDISAGKAAEGIADGGEVPGAPASNIFAAVNDVAAQITDLNQSALKPLLSSLNQQVGALGGVLEKSAPELMGHLVAIAADLSAKTPRITSDVERMTGTLSAKVVTDGNAEQFRQTLANMAQLSAGLQDSRQKVDSVLSALDKAVGGNKDALDHSIKDLRHTLEAVSRNIDSITYNLDGTTRNLHEFSRQIRDNPGVLIGGNKRGEDGPGRK